MFRVRVVILNGFAFVKLILDKIPFWGLSWSPDMGTEQNDSQCCFVFFSHSSYDMDLCWLYKHDASLLHNHESGELIYGQTPRKLEDLQPSVRVRLSNFKPVTFQGYVRLHGTGSEPFRLLSTRNRSSPIQVFTRGSSGNGPERLQMDPKLDVQKKQIQCWIHLNPFGSRTVSCKQKAYQIRFSDRIHLDPFGTGPVSSKSRRAHVSRLLTIREWGSRNEICDREVFSELNVFIYNRNRRKQHSEPIRTRSKHDVTRTNARCKRVRTSRDWKCEWVTDCCSR